MHFVLPIFLRLILLLKIPLRFASAFYVTGVYLLLSCLNATLQLSKSAVFTKVRQRRSSLIDLFVQFRDCFANLLDLKPMLLYFRLKLIDSVGAILKPFATLIPYVPVLLSLRNTYNVRGTHRSMRLLAPSSLSALRLSS